MINFNTSYKNKQAVSFGTNLQINTNIINDMKLLPQEPKSEIDAHIIASKRLVMLKESLQLNRHNDTLTYVELKGQRYMILNDDCGNKLFVEDPLKGNNVPKNTADYVSAVVEGILSGYKELCKLSDLKKAEKEKAEMEKKAKEAELKAQEQENQRNAQQMAIETTRLQENTNWSNSLLERLKAN